MENFTFIPVKKKVYQLQAMIYGKELLPKEIQCPVTNYSFTLEQEKSRIVMQGLFGELWPISDERFCATYQTIKGGEYTIEWLNSILSNGRNYIEVTVQTIPVENKMWALHIPLSSSYILKMKEGYEVPVNGAGEEHYGGDYIVCPDNGDAPNLSHIWAVNGRVFHRTYELAEPHSVPIADFVP